MLPRGKVVELSIPGGALASPVSRTLLPPAVMHCRIGDFFLSYSIRSIYTVYAQPILINPEYLC
jgi:hypothetical protein